MRIEVENGARKLNTNSMFFLRRARDTPSERWKVGPTSSVEARQDSKSPTSVFPSRTNEKTSKTLTSCPANGRPSGRSPPPAQALRLFLHRPLPETSPIQNPLSWRSLLALLRRIRDRFPHRRRHPSVAAGRQSGPRNPPRRDRRSRGRPFDA